MFELDWTLVEADVNMESKLLEFFQGRLHCTALSSLKLMPNCRARQLLQH